MDNRYTTQLEYTGHISGTTQHVVRFCGDYVGDSETPQGALLIESNHVAKRGLDLVASYDTGDGVVLWLKGGKNHRIVYGAEILNTKDDIEAAHKYGECVRHSAECAGLLD